MVSVMMSRTPDSRVMKVDHSEADTVLGWSGGRLYGECVGRGEEVF